MHGPAPLTCPPCWAPPRGQRPSLDQVYGSTWYVSGAGSVLFVTGKAGDPAVLLRNAPGGLTARELAAVLIGGGDPDRADVEKARRYLGRLVDSGLATRADGVAGGAGGGRQTRY